jgi:hypothetical protein
VLPQGKERHNNLDNMTVSIKLLSQILKPSKKAQNGFRADGAQKNPPGGP